MGARGDRSRLAGPALTAAIVVFSIASMGALRLWAGEPGQGRGPADAVALALLRADLDRVPADSALRMRLVREQLDLGMYPEAERTLSPLLAAGSAPPGAALLALDVSLRAWRATPPDGRERWEAQTRAVRRIETFLPRQTTPDELQRTASIARELGRPDLAARAQERAAALEPDRLRSMQLGLAAVDAYRAADDGKEALRLAEKLVERFPSQRSVLEGALAIALAQNDPERARRFGERLLSMGTLDAVSLGRQLDLELAAGDLDAASATADRLVAAAPRDPGSRLTAARVHVWAGKPRQALRQWMWLATHRGSAADIDEALALGRALRDEAAVAELLRLRSRNRPLGAASMAELVHALESTATPYRAITALERYVAVRPNRWEAWEALAATQERRREFAAALATRVEIARRFGPSLAGSLAIAKLQWALGKRPAALAELERFIDSAATAPVEYWEVLAEIAWEEEADSVALRAYHALWESGHIDVAGAERLLILARDAGRADDLIRIGRLGWLRMHQPRLLLFAMDEAARIGRWAEVERLASEAIASVDDFAKLPAYWMLRARADERAGRIPQAIEAYGRALAGDPKSKAARAGILWLLSGAHQRGPLSEYLATWADDVPDDPELSRAYVAGLEALRAVPDPGRRPLTAAAGAEVGGESLGNVVLAQQRAFARAQISAGELELREGVIAVVGGEPRVRGPGAETRVSAHARLPGLGGETELVGGLSTRRDGNVLQAGVARTQRLSTAGDARLEAFLHEPADESLALRMQAVRTRVGGSLAVREGAAYQRVALDWKRWATRAGGALGTGAAANVEIGWRGQSPDLVVRFQGGYQRNRLSGGIAAPLSVYATDPSAILPDELAALGVGAGIAQLPVGPLRLAADAWVGWVGPPFRPAFRVQTGIAATPFSNGELAMAAFAANDRWGVGGNAGVTLSFTHRFGF